jgi:[pyruvate, water dikinase]-phosphate phosphotransferase / [pyruvate, water dikinase] kinase
MPQKERQKRHIVTVISDGQGVTAERVVRATLTQFNRSVGIDLINHVDTVAQIEEAVGRTGSRNGILAYTLVNKTLRNEIVSLANEAGVIAVDLLGPLMAAISDVLASAPSHQPGLYSEPSAEHYERLEAVSFTVRHDDGLIPHEMSLADLVIVGPSRTSKTPLSVYLAHTRGLKVANVPLALGVEPFEELKEIDPSRVVGLTMNADLLARVRRVRLAEMGEPNIAYAQYEHVQSELKFCHEFYRRPPGWAVVDMTGKSIEEVASTVCSLTVDSVAAKGAS